MKLARSQVSNSLLALSTLWLASPALVVPASNVLVVDDDGPAPFATIQAAVDAAQDGDVVLVRPGNYVGFRIADKALVVVGDVGAEIVVQGGIRVVDLAAHRLVVLANLSSTGTASVDPELSSALDLTNNAGTVRVEACLMTGGGQFHNSYGVRARASADVALVGCDVRAGPSSSSTLVGADGIAAELGSVVTVYGSAVRGGSGVPTICSNYGIDGGDGGDVRDSFLFGANSSFHGGRGGHTGTGSMFGCPSAGDGGDGIRATNAFVHLFDTATVAGLGGHGISPGCGGDCAYLGYAGSDRSGGTFSDLPGDARMLSSQTPAYAGTTTTVTLHGSPGDQVALFVSGTTAPAEFVPNWNGMLLVPRPMPGGTTRVRRVGTIPASGMLTVPFVLPPLASARTIFVQALFRDTQGRFYLSGARCLTVLP